MPRAIRPPRSRKFLRRFPDDDACVAALYDARWSDGFSCPKCGHEDDPVFLRARTLWQCRACRHQTSVTARTALHATKLPLRHWLFAVAVFAGRRGRISARELQRRLSIGKYGSAWALLHKLREALGGRPVDDDAVELLCAALPPKTIDKKTRGLTIPRGLLVVAGPTTLRAQATRPPRDEHMPGEGAARRFFDLFVDTLRLVHHGVSSGYLSSYVRAQCFAFEPAATLHADILARLTASPHRSIEQVRARGLA